MRLWMIPVGVLVAVALVASAAAMLPGSWAFLTIATAIVVMLGAAPVVLAAYTRRIELRQRRRDGDHQRSRRGDD